MPAIGLLNELTSGIGPIFVTRYGRWPSKHPISSTHCLNQEADCFQEDSHKRIRRTGTKPL